VDDDGDWWRRPLGDLFARRRVVLAGGVAAGWTPLVTVIRRLGASDVLVVATEGAGVGPPPEARVIAIDAAGDGIDMMGRVRAGLAALRQPPPEVAEAVEAFDPDRRAVVLGVFLNEAAELLGRPFLAHRRPDWVALEDKTRVDELLDRAGVGRAPSAVVAVADAARARHRFDEGQGTVWAADATRGYHGGASGTRWVVDDEDAARATRDLAPMAATVRVMPFLDGIATSIHGIVLPDGVATLRPVELVTLRRAREFVYSGCATFWDPPDGVRREMKDAARRLGAVLRESVGFRGAFTLDGVATADGFRPTELNPRFGAGLNVMTRGLPDLPLLLVLDLVVAGHHLDITAARLEELLVEQADAQRAGGTWNLHAGLPAPLPERSVAYHDGRWRWTAPDEPGDAVAVGAGDFVRATWDPARTPVGPSVGPRAAAFWEFLDGELGTAIGPLEAAPDLRRNL
jgi:hypothetical protein